MAIEISLEGKLAVVTGASGGIGSAVMERLGAAGAEVVGFDVKAGENIQAVDITNGESVTAAFWDLQRGWGCPAHILVNCAGITEDAGAMKMTEENFMLVLEVNLLGSFLPAQAMARQLKTAGLPGSIVNFSSISSGGNPGQANYSASKGGVEAMTRTLAKEWGRYGIRVNAIAPGPVDTSMWQATTEAVQKAALAQTPLGKIAQPVDIANEALLLASDLTSHVTGEVRVVSGGLHFS